MKALVLFFVISLGFSTGCSTTMRDGKEYYVLTIHTPSSSDPVVIAGEVAVLVICTTQPKRRGCGKD